MRRFVLGWKRRGAEHRLQAKIVSYADDYIICCKGDVDQALAGMYEMTRRLKLTVNEAKTRVCHLPKERFDFVGYTFGRYYSPQTGSAYLSPWPSQRSVQRLIGAIREATERRTPWLEADEMVQTINRKLIGWANYFSLGPTGKAYRAIDRYTARRLRRWWLCKKERRLETDSRCFDCDTSREWRERLSCDAGICRVEWLTYRSRPEILNPTRPPKGSESVLRGEVWPASQKRQSRGRAASCPASARNHATARVQAISGSIGESSDCRLLCAIYPDPRRPKTLWPTTRMPA